MKNVEVKWGNDNVGIKDTGSELKLSVIGLFNTKRYLQ
jgi:hypothetical protein